MTLRSEEAARPWRDSAFATAWADNDAQQELLALPRAMAAAMVAADRPDARLILDIGAGPGAMLEAFLTELPEAEGIWCDASEAMLELARRRLAPFGDRVRYLLGDMTDLDGAGIPDDLDAAVTSRAAHHLDASTLETFYAGVARRLQPGGWLVNLDHISPTLGWEARYREVRKRFVRPVSSERRHHEHPLPSAEDHLIAMQAAGAVDVDVAWKAFHTCLFLGRTAADTGLH